jgi:hypothetical protein
MFSTILSHVQGKHESIVHEVWSLLGYLSSSFDLPLVSHIFDKIKTIPANCYDVQYVDFLKEITDRALNLSLMESDLGESLFDVVFCFVFALFCLRISVHFYDFVFLSDAQTPSRGSGMVLRRCGTAWRPIASRRHSRRTL